MHTLILAILSSLLLDQILVLLKISKPQTDRFHMALVKFGTVIVEMRGKSGGNVFSRNAGGAYMKNKVSPTNPQTVAQVAARNRLITQSQAWRGLTDPERAAWIASTPDYMKTNIFGDSVKPSGFALHNALNATLDLVGVAALSAPPAPVAIAGLSLNTLTMANGADTASIVFATSPVPADFAILIFMTGGVSAGKSFVKSEYRLITFEDAAGTTPIDIKADYALVHGSIPAAGLKVFCRLIPVSKTTGQRGVALDSSAIVAA